jgi:protein-L-isoaspartate(D-aspartate) O-methyltransferase
MADLAALREEMVRKQIAGRGINAARLLEAFRLVPREDFVPEGLREAAYEDGPLGIEAGQTISQPYIVALMIDAAGVARGRRVLEVGAGSGYAAAVMGRIADQVIAIERHPELAGLARERMERLGFGNVRIVVGDGTEGLPDEAPFDAILCSASGSHVPETLRRQLSIGGILVIPVGEPDAVQKLVKVTRRGEEEFDEEELGPVRFVPLIGAHGWADPRGEKR